MAITLSEEEIKKINEELKKKRETPTLSTDFYRQQLENLGKETHFDYIKDFDKIKNSLLQTSYSPYTKKTYSDDEKQNLTEEQYYNDLMDTAKYTEDFTTWKDVANSAMSSSVKNLLLPGFGIVDSAKAVYDALNTREGKSFLYGLNEMTGGTALYKAIYGEDALNEKINQVRNVYNRPLAQLGGNAVGVAAMMELGNTAGSAIGAGTTASAANAAKGAIAGRAIAGGISGGSRAYTYSNNPVDIVAGTAAGSTYGLISGATSNLVKSSILNYKPTLITKAATDFGVNAASSGVGAYAGTVGSGTLSNAISALGGKEVKIDDWIKPFWSVDTLTNVAIASVLGGITGTVKDQQEVKKLPDVVKKDVQTMYAEGHAKAKAMDSALKNGNVEDAKTLAASEIDSIERLGNKQYVGGLHMGESFKQNAINDWAKLTEEIFKRNGYDFEISSTTGSTGSSPINTSGLIPTYGSVVDTTNPTAYNMGIGGADNAMGRELGNQQNEKIGETKGAKGGTFGLSSGVQRTSKGDLHIRETGEIISKISEQDKSGYYEQSGNPKLNTSFEKQAVAKKEATAKFLQNEPPIKTVERKFTQELAKIGYIDLNGKTIKNFKELADIAQLFRNPKYETFRIIYVKGDKIVGQEAFTSRMPDYSDMYEKPKKDTERTAFVKATYKMKERMKRLGADGYYLLHNHPSGGTAFIGGGDFNQTTMMANEVDGFQGHLVTNSGTYALMTPDANEDYGYKVQDGIKIENYEADNIDKMMSKSPWLNEEFTEDKLIQLGYSLKNDPNYSMVILTDSQNQPRIILDVKDTFFNQPQKDVNNWIKNVARENGGAYAYLATSNSDIYQKTKVGGTGEARAYPFNDIVLYEINPKGELVAVSQTNPNYGSNRKENYRISGKAPSLEKNIPSYRVYEDTKGISKLEDVNNNLRNELVKKDDKIQATEMWSKRTERAKLNKKLDTAKDKLAQTKYNDKQKIQATKAEKKEALHRLTSKKNEEKKEAVKEVKQKAGETLKAQKENSKEKIKDAKQQAKATTTEKKVTLAEKRLDKALEKVYDKPLTEGKEKAIENIQKQARGMIKLVDKVKNKLPSSYSAFVDDVMDIADTYYTGGNTMSEEKRVSLEQKAKDIQKYIEEHPEYPVSPKAIELLKEPNKKNIADLNEKDLVSLAEDLQEIGRAVRDMFSFSRANEDAVKLRQEAINYAKDLYNNGKTRAGKNLNNSLYTPKEIVEDWRDKRSTLRTMVLRLAGGNPSSPFKFISDQILEGYDRYNRATDKMLKIFDKFVDVKKVGNLRVFSNKLNNIFNHKNTLDVELKTENGGTYKPSVADAISVVLGSKDPQYAGHTVGYFTGKFNSPKYNASELPENGAKPNKISGYKLAEKEPEISKGGIARFANKLDEQHGKIAKGQRRGENIKLSMDDIQKMRKELETKYPEFKDLEKAFKELSDLRYKLVNESYEAINGTSLDYRENYFQIITDPAQRVIQHAGEKIGSSIKGHNGLDASNTLLNMGMVQPIVEGANNQILVYPIDDVIRKMIDEAALYYGYATALYDINTFLSATDENGKTLVSLINDIDPNFMSNYGKISNNIVGNIKNQNGGTLASRYTNSILQANPYLALKQAGSYFTVAKYFDHPIRSMLAGAFNKKGIASAIKKMYKEQGTDLSKLNVDETLKYFWDDKVNSELSIRSRGWNKADKQNLLKYSGIMERIKALDFFKGVDYATVRAIAAAMVNDMLLNGEFNYENDQAFTNLSNEFLTAHTTTQPNSSPATRAPIQSGNVVDRALAYMADPRLKNRNMLAEAYMTKKYYSKNGTKEEKSKAKKEYWKAIVGTLGSLAYITEVSRMKKKIEDKENSNVISDLFGNGIALSIGLEQIVGIFLNEYSFDVTLPDTQAVNLIINIGKTFKELPEHISQGKTDKVAKDVDKLLEYLASFSGVPYKNLKTTYNDLLSIMGNKKQSNSNKKKEKESKNSKLDAI